MNTISVNYTCKYRIKDNTNYWFTNCGKCYNSKTGRILKQVYKSGCLGYTIKGKFISLTKLRTQLELIPKINCPF